MAASSWSAERADGSRRSRAPPARAHAGAALVQVATTPDPTGLPGGAALQKLLNGLVFVGLLGCVAAIVVGGATWFVGSQAGNFTASLGGRRSVVAGMIGALVIGAAAAIVNFFFAAGGAVR